MATPEGQHPLSWRPAAEFPAQVLKRALRDLELHMSGALRPQVAEHIMRLQTLTRSREAGVEDWNARAAEYYRLLGHYPNDIWQDAIDEWLQNPEQGKWFPTIAELTGLMGKRLFERKLMIDRLGMMLQPRPANDHEPKEPRPVRLRAIIGAFKDSTNLRYMAVNAERELAEIERRPVEGWARGVPVVTEEGK